MERNPTDPENREIVEDQLSEIDRMDALLSDLLILARLDAERLDVEDKPFDLATVAVEAAGRFLTRAAEEGVRLEVEVPDELPVHGDPGRTDQILAALLDNAVRHTPKGGTITVSGRPLDSPTRRAEASVTDTGPGIPRSTCRASSTASTAPKRPAPERAGARAWASPSPATSPAPRTATSPPRTRAKGWSELHAKAPHWSLTQFFGGSLLFPSEALPCFPARPVGGVQNPLWRIFGFSEGSDLLGDTGLGSARTSRRSYLEANAPSNKTFGFALIRSGFSTLIHEPRRPWRQRVAIFSCGGRQLCKRAGLNLRACGVLAAIGSRGLYSGERRTVYSMLGLRVEVLPDRSLRVRGAFGEESLFWESVRT